MDGVDRFTAHFKVPRSQLNKIRKEYETSKEASQQIDPSKFKNFQDLSSSVFDFFEEFTGKRVNRELMIGHISYYLDEGFEIEDMIAHIRKEFESDYYRSNPEWFVVNRLFPIKDQDRINTVWDLLAHHQMVRSAGPKKSNNIKIRVKCGQVIDAGDYEAHSIECFNAKGACFFVGAKHG